MKYIRLKYAIINKLVGYIVMSCIKYFTMLSQIVLYLYRKIRVQYVNGYVTLIYDKLLAMICICYRYIHE